jgi:O-antigen/teichoic acid export membrane protein
MIQNIVANFIGKFWSILSNFLFVPLYIHYLGFESFSIISFTLVIASLMAVIDAGLTATLSREFARDDNCGDEKIRIFKTLESSYFILIGLSIVLVYAISGTIANNWLNLSSFDPNRISFFLKIMSFDIGFQLLLRFYMGGLLGFEKHVKANMYQVGWGILRNGIVIFAIIIFPTLEMFFLWQTFSTIIFSILVGLSLKKELSGHYKFDFSFRIEKSVFKKIWRFAGGMLLISLVASLNTQMDKLTISKLLPIESLGYYTLAVSLSMGITVFVSPISIALLPRFTALYSTGKKSEASLLFHKINLFVSIIVFTVTAIMAIFAKELLWIWTGNLDLAENASIYLPIIAVSTAMLSIATIPYNIAIANGYTKLNNLLGLFSLLITLPGYWIAINYFGAIGAAYLFCGVQTGTTLIYLYIISIKFINTHKMSELYINGIFFPFVISLCFAFGFSFTPEWAEQNRLYALIWIGMATLVTFLASFLFLFPKNDVKRILLVLFYKS